ncbi:MAG: GTP cyclohydrolase I FolE [Bacteroides sp.]|nr:GTP cyclohydrolase I FolE [Bacteroides sp.]MCM1095652.1 GTP cyclohydrolase I FolE [Terasakiella sp.]
MTPEEVKLMTPEERVAAIAARYADIIALVGEDPERDGLVKTPERAAKALWHCTQGYRTDPRAIISGALFEAEGSRIVTVRDIEFYSMCEHHILPFFGTVSIAYLPGDKIVGLSKLARIVDAFSRRLQVQERLTAQLCTEVMEAIGARGVAVKCTAEHLCMKMRGVEKQQSATVTIEYAGLLATDPTLRAEALALL